MPGEGCGRGFWGLWAVPPQPVTLPAFSSSSTSLFQHPLPDSNPDSLLEFVKSSAGDFSKKSGQRTMDLGTLGLLPAWYLQSLGSTWTQMFSLSQTLTSSHDPRHSLVTDHMLLNPHLPCVDFGPVNWLMADTRVVHNFPHIILSWPPFLTVA